MNVLNIVACSFGWVFIIITVGFLLYWIIRKTLWMFISPEVDNQIYEAHSTMYRSILNELHENYRLIKKRKK